MNSKNPITSDLRRSVLLFVVFMLTLCGVRVADAAPNEVWESGGEYHWKIADVHRGSSTDLSTAIARCLWDSGGYGREIHVLTGGDLSSTLTLPGDVKVFFHGNTFNITHNNYGVHGRGDYNVELHDATFVSGPYYVFRITGCNNFLASGINIDGGGIGMRIDSSDSREPWRFTAYNLTVKNCRFENLSSHGLETYGIDGVHVDGIVARNVGGSGVLFNASRNGYVGSVDAYRCSYGGGYAGLRFANGNSNFLVKYLRAIECGRGFFTTTGAWDIEVEEVYIRGCSSHAILLQDSHQVGINSGTHDGFVIYHYTSRNCWIHATDGRDVTDPPPTAPASLTATKGATSVSLSWPAVTGATSYRLLRSVNNDGRFRTIGILDITSFVDREITPGTNYQYVVRAVNAAGPGARSPEATVAFGSFTRVPDVTSGLQRHYTFDGSGADSQGGVAATIAGTASYGSGMKGQALILDGASSYATLPALVGSDFRDFTAAGWLWLGSSEAWQRVFDFGSGTSNYMMMTRTAHHVYFDINHNGSVYRVQTDVPPLDRWVHLAVSFAGNWATIYLNGEPHRRVLFGSSPANLTISQNFLGKSQWPNDPFLKGRVDDFRLYSRGLLSAEMMQLVQDSSALPPYDLIAGGFGNKVNLSWTGTINAASYNVKRATTSGGPYATVATGITGTTYSDTTVSSGMKYYYVVSGTNSNGESTNSNEDAAVVSDLTAHLKFDETLGTEASDYTGNGWNGTLANGASFVGGVLRNALSLPNSAGQHATLPKGVVSGLDDFTISTWVRVSALETWSRIFDFGTGTDNFMFLTTQYDGSTANARKLRFAIRTPAVDQQVINSATAIPAEDTWVHVAVTLSGTTGRMYLNGALVGTNGGMTLRPSSLGHTTWNFLGRSQFNDPIFNGSIDDFRIYSRALTRPEVAMLADPMPEAPESVHIMPSDGSITLKWDVANAATGYEVRRANNSGGPFETIATDLMDLTYKDTGVANGLPYFYVVVGKSARGESPPSAEVVGIPSQLRLHLRFDELSGATAYDSATGGRHARVINGGTWGVGRIGNAVQISGSPQHVELPSEIIEDLPSLTVMSWVRINTLNTFSRIFDFGAGTGTPSSSTGSYMMLTPSQNNGIRFAITTGGYGSEQEVLSSTGTMPIGVWTHVAVTLSETTGRLYVNGSQVGINTTMTLNPTSLGTINRAYLGRSMYPNDPYLNGALDDFRIYTRALGAEEVALFATPLQAPQNVVAEGGSQRVDLSWSAVPNTTSYTVRWAPELTGPFEVLAADVTSTSFSHDDLNVGDTRFYQVCAVNFTGEGPMSPVVSGTAAGNTSGGTKKEQWRILHFGTSDSIGDAADDADPDADGISNYLEYALGSNPMLNDPSALPQGSIAENHLRIEFGLIDDPELLYEVIASENMTTWDLAWSSQGKNLDAGSMIVIDPVPVSSVRRRFLRLRVSSSFNE